MKITKYLKQITCDKVIIALAVIFLAYSVFNYSSKFSLFTEKYTPAAEEVRTVRNTLPVPDDTLGQNRVGYNRNLDLSPAPRDNLKTDIHGLPPSCVRQKIVNPTELLPNDANSEWAKLNPMGGGGLKGINLLKAGVHQGIDTVGSTLRNPSLDIRSEPANPQVAPGPWNLSTMSPDIGKRPLEVGCQGRTRTYN